MQPVVDAKTGDKLMQQVLVLPKNLFIQQKDDRTPQINHPTQCDVAQQHCAFNVPLSSSTTGHTDSRASPLTVSKSVLSSTRCATLPVSQSQISTFASSTSMSTCETNKNRAPDFLATMVSSNYSQSLHIKPDFGRVTSSTGSPAVQMANSSPAPQRDISEAKQELRTVCIRDSQSILVRTRGGNTGVVKVQSSQDQGTSVLSPSPIFTFTPQLQPFLVSRTKPSTTSTSAFTPVTTSQTDFSSASAGLNQVTESNTNWAQVQHPAPRVTIQTVVNPMQSNFLPIISQASTGLSTNSVINTAAGTVTPISCCSTGKDCSVIRKAGTDLKQAETQSASVSVVQPDSTTPSKSDFVSGSSIHQVMLLTAPSIHPPGTSQNMSIVASPTLAQVPSKKFVFINTQLPASSSSANMTPPASKQTTNTNIGKMYVRPPEQQQVFLIPSTMGSPLKMSSPPIVSQVKDVKIGLTIGQTIVNNTAGMKNILPINILQNPLGKGDIGTRKDSAVLTVPTLPKVHSEQVTSSNITCDYNVASTKGSAACAAVTPSNIVQYSATEGKGNDFLKTLSSVSSRLPTSSLGSTVAISTVKTGHLSSSVLLTTNPMTEHAKHASSSLQRPVSSTLSGITSGLGSTPIASTYQPTLREQSENNNSKSQNIHKVVSTNVTSPPATMSSSLLSTLCKTGPWHTSSQTLPLLPASTLNQARPQMNESSAHHKLVINTSTPLAPGTQITINGTRFIVPPQGLGAGSHVLLLSTNAKQGPPSIGSTQASHGSPPFISTTAQQPALKQNISPPRYPVQTFTCTAAPDLSKSLHNIQPTSQIVNITSSDFSSCSLSSVNKSLSTTALQPLLDPCIQRGSYPQQTNMAPLSKGTPVTEAIMLNIAKPPSNLLPVSAMSESKREDTDSFKHQPLTTDKPRTVAT
ncbi:unnamed protein product [Staurois parvus]|uniref:Uncharacterized protein n=1 Tax=Staurois parvus TaxID=386267 RepID=A0ABN9H933_9NEOB|nr:unnamed protein product [Staurois parvus]